MRNSKKINNRAYLYVGLLLAFLGYFPMLHAQSGSYTYPSTNNNHYFDYTVPSGTQFLYLEAIGGDGGRRNNTGRKQKGGKGSEVSGYVTIGNGVGEIPVGSTLRFIPGQAGGSDVYCGGGGGGSAIAFLKDINSNWKLLLAAGGGGGAGRRHNGREGVTSTSGSGGVSEGGDYANNGGSDGNISSSGSDAGHGGGYFSGGGNSYGRAGISTTLDSIPIGGSGGSGDKDGGFGVGGGGGGDRNWGAAQAAGGGGGGYSGGGGGYRNGGGGGGGSYTNSDYVFSVTKQSMGTTYDPQNGEVSFEFKDSKPAEATLKLTSTTNKCIRVESEDLHDGNDMEVWTCDPYAITQSWKIDGSEIKLMADDTKCINVDGASTSVGANIRIKNCNGTKAQKWIYDGITNQFRSPLNLDRCMDASLTNGSNVKLWSCSTTTHQKLDLTGVTTISEPTEVKYIVEVKYGKRVLQSISGAKWNSNVQLGEKSSTDGSVSWVFEDQQIKYGGSRDLCLGLDNGSTASGTNIKLMGSASSSDTRQWVYDGMTKQIRSVANPDKCIEVETTGSYTVGSNLKLMDCTENLLRQQFDIETR